MGQGDENLEIVRTIVTLAKNLNMDVVAESIETQEQYAQLHALGCQYGQGYLFSKPLDMNAVCDFIEREQQTTSDVTPLPVPTEIATINSPLMM